MTEQDTNLKSSASLLNHQIGDNQIFFKFGFRLRELRLFYDAGVSAALHEALIMLRGEEEITEGRDDTVLVPEWVVAGAAKIVGERLSDGRSTGKGQSGNERKKYQNDMKNYYRWRTIRYLREVEGVLGSKTYAVAKARFKGTFAGNVGVDAIKKSYQRVKTGLKDPHKALRYFRARGETRDLAGISLIKK